jgi:hypothetical protein
MLNLFLDKGIGGLSGIGDRPEFRKFGILLVEGLNLQGVFVVSGKMDRKFGQSSCENR